MTAPIDLPATLELLREFESQCGTPRDLATLQALVRALPGMVEDGKRLRDLTEPRDEADYHEDEGPVLWWSSPISEPPYVGTLLDSDFPQNATHWTRLHVPPELCISDYGGGGPLTPIDEEGTP